MAIFRSGLGKPKDNVPFSVPEQAEARCQRAQRGWTRIDCPTPPDAGTELTRTLAAEEFNKIEIRMRTFGAELIEFVLTS